MCFSGGGVRAASFDCGVLMKMGELGLLKEMDHLSAVSGGGYTASAYLTHLQYCDAPLPRDGKGADDMGAVRRGAEVARRPPAASARAVRPRRPSAPAAV